MPLLFGALLALSLACALAVALTQRRALRFALMALLFASWIAFAFTLSQVALRTSSTIVIPGRQPHLVGEAGHEALTLLASFGFPLLIATVLGWLALRATRSPRRS